MGVSGVESSGELKQLEEGSGNRGHLDAVSTPAPIQTRNRRNYLPEDVKNALASMCFSSFDKMRVELNKAMARSEEARVNFGFTSLDLAEMAAGRNPYAAEEVQLGKRVKLEYDHVRERRDGHLWSDLENLRLVSPVAHKHKIIRSFYKAAGAG